MVTLVAIFSYNRPNLLKLTLGNLLEGYPAHDTFEIFDDDSDNQELISYYDELEDTLGGVFVQNDGAAHMESRVDYHARARRLAVLRARAVDCFLEGNCYDYLLMLDDDILTNWDAIQEAIEDFEFLKTTDWADIGALTLHGHSTHQGYTQIDGKVFSELRITGEANVLFSKEALLKTGNHFAPVPKGFADLQFDALREAGFRYYDRVWPTYEVQHLGFGPSSSTIHRNEKTPSWCTHPYRCTYTRRDMGVPLSVRGFDLRAFAEIASTKGAEAAALAVHEGRKVQ